jgi:hypothetical protein
MILDIATPGNFYATLGDSDLYLSLFAGLFFCVIAAIGFSLAIKKGGRVLWFFSLSWLFDALYLIVDSFALIFQNVIYFKLAFSVFVSLQFMFFMAFLEYAQNDQLGWKKMGVGVAVAVALILWMWHPADQVELVVTQSSSGPIFDYYITYKIFFTALSDGYLLILSIFYFYWTTVTFRAVPQSMKKHGSGLLVAGVLFFLSGALLVMSDFGLGEPNAFGTTTGSVAFATISGLLIYLALIVAAVISVFVIYKAPTIIHLLPYKAYRLIITSKNGTPYMEHVWSQHEVNSVLLAGLFSALGSMAKATLTELNTGSITEIRLQNAVFLTETQFSPVNIGLLASKSSKDLRENLGKFAESFVKKYYNILYDKDGFPVELRQDPADVFKDADMNPLVQEYFANIPSFVAQGLTSDELLARQSEKASHQVWENLPPSIESRLKDVATPGEATPETPEAPKDQPEVNPEHPDDNDS